MVLFFGFPKWTNVKKIREIRGVFQKKYSHIAIVVKKLCKSKNLSNHRVVMLKNPLQVTCDLLVVQCLLRNNMTLESCNLPSIETEMASDSLHEVRGGK